MKKKTGLINRLLPLLLGVLLFASAAAPACAEEPPAAEESGIIDADALTAMTEEFISAHGIPAGSFSIGYCYTATGDEWFYNGDKWYYPASMYKVPLMMQLAEQVKSGQRSQDDIIEGRSVSEMEELILTYSNNDMAHVIRKELGGDAVWREAAKVYAGLPDDYYITDYADYCYFTPRYMTKVMETLFREPERFPNITECLLNAQPTNYFRLSDRINGVYDTAQKYGSFCDSLGNNFNHNTGIIYTPNPCIVTVMTVNVQNYEKVISDAAVMLTEYTLSLDEMLRPYTEEKEAAAEAERQAEADRAEAERQAREREEQEKAAQAERQAILEKHARIRKDIVIAGAVLIFAALVIILADALMQRQRKKRRLAEYARRYEAEKRRAASGENRRAGK